MEKITHLADGLYGISYNKLVSLGACVHARILFVDYAQTNIPNWTHDMVVPVTADIVWHVHSELRAVFWLVDFMSSRKRITKREYDYFRLAYTPAPHGFPEVAVFMDLLLKRAKREGLLS